MYKMKNKILNKLLIMTGIFILILNLNINFIEAEYLKISFNYNTNTDELKITYLEIKQNIADEYVGYYESQFLNFENLPYYTLRTKDSGKNLLSIGIFYTSECLMYDWIDESTGMISGGETECKIRKDFSINVPYNSKTRYISITSPARKEIINYNL